MALLILPALACSDTTGPATGGVSRGTAVVTVYGDFSPTQHDSLTDDMVYARMAVQEPIPGATDPHFHPWTGLRLAWRGSPHGTRPEPVEMYVEIPDYIDFSAPRTFSFATDSLPNGFTVYRVNGGPVEYEATHGTITITAASESTLVGTITAGYDRGPVGAHVILTGRFNAFRCKDAPGEVCVPPQTY